jgi:hypothetical protein
MYKSPQQQGICGGKGNKAKLSPKLSTGFVDNSHAINMHHYRLGANFIGNAFDKVIGHIKTCG